jgi:hypothetical protein
MNYADLVSAIQAYTENTETNFVAEIPVFVRQAEQRIYNVAQPSFLRENVTGVLTTGNKFLQCPTDFLSAYSLAIFPNNSTTATGTSGLKTIVVASAAGIAAGQQVTGTGIGVNALVRGIVGTTVTLTVANSGTVSGTVIFQGDNLYLLNKDVNFIREAYPLTAQLGEPKHYAIFGPRSDNERELTFILGPTPNANYTAELHYYYYPESIVTAGTTWLGDNFDTTLLYGSLVEAYTYMKGEADMLKLYQERYVQAIALYKNLADGKQRGDAYRDGQVRVSVS